MIKIKNRFQYYIIFNEFLILFLRVSIKVRALKIDMKWKNFLYDKKIS